MGSTIADNAPQCTPRLVTIEHEKPIPDRYPVNLGNKICVGRLREIRDVVTGDTTIPPATRRPPQADIQMTKAIIDIATRSASSVHDHIIVGKNGHASMRG